MEAERIAEIERRRTQYRWIESDVMELIRGVTTLIAERTHLARRIKKLKEVLLKINHLPRTTDAKGQEYVRVILEDMTLLSSVAITDDSLPEDEPPNALADTAEVLRLNMPDRRACTCNVRIIDGKAYMESCRHHSTALEMHDHRLGQEQAIQELERKNQWQQAAITKSRKALKQIMIRGLRGASNDTHAQTRHKVARLIEIADITLADTAEESSQ